MSPESRRPLKRSLVRILARFTASMILITACGGDDLTAASGNPLPTLLGLDPSVLNAGSSAATVRATGSSFLQTSKVRWDGAERPTRYLSATELEFDLSTSDLAAMDTARITVVNPAPGGGESGFLPLTVGYPTPSITSVSPSTFATGSISVFLTITGTGFTTRTLVFWDAETAGFQANVMSPTEMRVQIPSFVYPTARSYTIHVRNPSPGGGESNRLSVDVTAKSPALGANP